MKKLKSGHDRPHRVMRDEDGVLLVDEEQVTATWRRHWAELLHGQEGGILAKRQAPAAFPFLCGKRAAKAAHEQ